MKVNLVAKIMQSAYLRFIFSLRAIMRGSCFHVMHKKIIISRGFNLFSNSW